MGDELDIRRGGVVAVDTATLRAVAHRLEGLAARIAEAADGVHVAAHTFRAVEHETHDYNDVIVSVLADDIDRAGADARDLARSLLGTAAVYETIELNAERTLALSRGDASAVERIDARLAHLAGEHPWAALTAGIDIAWWRLVAPAEIFAQAWWGSQFLGPGSSSIPPALLVLASGLVSAVGAGTVPPSQRLTGTPTPVAVRPLAPATQATAPMGLAAAAGRIPRGEARVRVERYAMPDGTNEWAVYIPGTRDGDAEAFDWASNADLYFGQRSASYEATLEALRLAGAQAGDAVHAVGHSQGAMVGARLAMEGGYDVQTLVTLGSPIEAAVPSSTLSVTLRHTDDPVAALADHGTAAGVGAPGSFVAERVGDPEAGLRDLDMPVHDLELYMQTAAMVDGSTDPRVEAVRGVFAHLGDAASIEVVEYSATRAND